MSHQRFLAVSLGCYLSVCALAQVPAESSELFAQAAQLESKNPAEADRVYGQAARQGHVPSMVRLGYRLVSGSGDRQDLPRAFSLFIEAARTGDPDGQYLLAMSYLEGVGTARNPVTARETLLEPANHGHQFAQYTLGIMLQSGEGGPRREASARRWLDRAANGPDAKLAARAADFRDKIDARLFSPDDSTGKALTALAFVALLGAAVGGGSGSADIPAGPPSPFGGSSPIKSTPPPPPCRPTMVMPTNISKTVNGDITNPNLIPMGC
jgi:hypothetical protein